MGYDVFVSHSSKDKAVADAVVAALEARGVRCWVAPRDIPPGADWAAAIAGAIAACRVLVLVYSAHANRSEQVKREVERAVARGKALVPLRIEDVPPSPSLEYFVSTSQWLDALAPPLRPHLDRLAAAVLRLLTDAPSQPYDRPAGRPLAGGRGDDGVGATAIPPAAPSGPAAARPSARRRLAIAGALLLVVAVVLGLATATGRRGLAHLLSGGPPTATAPDPTPQPTSLPSSSPATAPVPQRPVPPATRSSTTVAIPPAVAATRPAGRSFTNSLEMTFVEVPAGEFLMGSPADEAERAADEVQHRVRLTRPFLLGTHEVTRGQFAAFVAADDYRTDAERAGFAHDWDGRLEELARRPGASWRDAGFDQSDGHPVVNVSWNDAVAFCRWLGTKEGETYRLPTEAEWEYAARAGGRGGAFPWGDEAAGGAGQANAADATARRQFPRWTTFAWDDGFVFTAPVGSFRANAWGVHDLTGNAWEWCHDRYAAYPPGGATDPGAPAGPPAPAAPGDEAPRVRRGGAWNANPHYSRTAGRNSDPPDTAYNFVGFRLCLDPK